MDRLRLLELVLRYPPAVGGVEGTVAQLVDGLRADGVDVRVATSDLERLRPFSRFPPAVPSPSSGVGRSRAFRTIPLPLGLGVAVPGILRAALTQEIDVIHAHAFGYFPTWSGAIARQLRGVPYVVTPHSDVGRGWTFSAPYHRVVARATLRRADRVIAQSELERRFLTGLGVERDRVVVLPSGIRVADFAGPPHSTDRPEVRALCLGRLELAQKGPDTLVRALAHVPASSRLRVRLVGDDWGARAGLVALAESIGVADRVSIVTGLTPEAVVREYGDADLFVLPSRFESFPRVLLEAMAAGLPIVSTRVGSVEAIVGEGENGWLVAPDDPPALAAALVGLENDPSTRARFGAESRRRAAGYDWSVLLPRYRALFDEVVATARAG